MTEPNENLKAPFPWFGGKSRVASLIWDRFGEVKTYIEPFAGSLAVLLKRPHTPHTEIVNDLDCFVANFWRATQADPAAVAKHTDWPCIKVDLQARHCWLTEQENFREHIRTDPHYYDVKIAGWWAWGQSSSIMGSWMAPGDSLPRLCLGRSHGVNAKSSSEESISLLSKRLRHVRILCDDWTRCVSTMALGIPSGNIPVGVLLDPPYADSANRQENLYHKDSLSVAHAVREWATLNGENPDLRLALCGYEGEHEMPSTWECVGWETSGGCGRVGKGEGLKNAKLERIWFSPHCLKPSDNELFRMMFEA